MSKEEKKVRTLTKRLQKLLKKATTQELKQEYHKSAWYYVYAYDVAHVLEDAKIKSEILSKLVEFENYFKQNLTSDNEERLKVEIQTSLNHAEEGLNDWDLTKVLFAYVSISILYQKLGEFTKCIEYIDKKCEIREEANFRRKHKNIGKKLNIIGPCPSCNANKYEEARACFKCGHDFHLEVKRILFRNKTIRNDFYFIMSHSLVITVLIIFISFIYNSMALFLVIGILFLQIGLGYLSFLIYYFSSKSKKKIRKIELEHLADWHITNSIIYLFFLASFAMIGDFGGFLIIFGIGVFLLIISIYALYDIYKKGDTYRVKERLLNSKTIFRFFIIFLMLTVLGIIMLVFAIMEGFNHTLFIFSFFFNVIGDPYVIYEVIIYIKKHSH